MDKSVFSNLLCEHKNDLAEIRSTALKFIKYVSEHINCGEDLEQMLLKKFNKEKLAELFIKMSTLVMKLIPLEHQVHGTYLINSSKLKGYINNCQEELKISEEDILTIKEFLTIYQKENLDHS